MLHDKHKDFDDIARELSDGSIRFNYTMLEDKGGFLSAMDRTVDTSDLEKTPAE